MVTTSRGPFQFHSRRAKFLKFLSGKLRSITVYIALLFVFFLFTLVYISRKGLEGDEQRGTSSEELRSEQNVETADVVHSKVHVQDEQLWGPPFSFGLHPCIKPTSKYKAAEETDRYITVRSNGGLNQMRTGIADIVAIARIMNATLIIPQLDRRSFWKDSSSFGDIFDESHFIESLEGDVRVMRALPKGLESIPHARRHFGSWSSMGYYEEMAHLFKDYQVIHVPKSDSRLANNDLPLDVQRLRCRTLYQALRFSPPIESLGKVLSRA